MMREELQDMRQMEEVSTGDLEEQELPEVIEENGLIYHLAEDGCYYPDLTFEQETDYPIGKYGLIRAEYMWEHKAHEYRMMLQDELGIGICMRWTRSVIRKLSWR